jgi:hypothetical protein
MTPMNADESRKRKAEKQTTLRSFSFLICVHLRSTVSGPCTAELISSTTLATSTLLGAPEPSRKPNDDLKPLGVWEKRDSRPRTEKEIRFKVARSLKCLVFINARYSMACVSIAA